MSMENTTKKHILLFGMDNVLYNTEEHLNHLYRERYPDGPTMEPEMIEDSYNLMEAERFYDKLPDIDGAVEALKKIAKSEKCLVFICTSPKTDNPEISVLKKIGFKPVLTFSIKKIQCEWIKKRLGENWEQRLIITHDKTLFYGDFLVDHIRDIQGCVNSPTWKHILFNHNQNFREQELRQNKIIDVIHHWNEDDWEHKIQKWKNEGLDVLNVNNCIKTQSMIILIDMDGVLCDFEKHMLDRFREKYPEEPFIKPEERRTFFLREQYETVKNGLGDKMHELMHVEGFFATLPEIEGAVDALNEMSSIPGVDVFICSSPLSKEPQICISEKYKWVKEHLGKYWLDRLILTSDKTLINGQILIDDKHQIRGCVEQPSWKHFLFNQCHNQHLNEEDFQNNDIYDRIVNWTDGSWKTQIVEYQRQFLAS